jgi:PAS domain S-box-containing protein
MHLQNAQRTAVPDAWYRWAVQSISGYGVFTTDLQNRIVTWDGGAEKMFGYRRDDVWGEDARFVFTPEDIEKKAPEIEIATAVANTSAPDERWHVRKEGTIFWASGLMMKLYDDQERHVGFIKIVRDRTAEKRASPEDWPERPKV